MDRADFELSWSDLSSLWCLLSLSDIVWAPMRFSILASMEAIDPNVSLNIHFKKSNAKYQTDVSLYAMTK